MAAGAGRDGSITFRGNVKRARL